MENGIGHGKTQCKVSNQCSVGQMKRAGFHPRQEGRPPPTATHHHWWPPQQKVPVRFQAGRGAGRSHAEDRSAHMVTICGATEPSRCPRS